ncbi:hypothetical protein B0T25DRAFT_594432 [Lasiosphaeria hispida]|uniref:Uncharacterized protein n=1 Tax=Lasiosphaeria hispida TaxID=260671 RepID=A0AAJ0H514_9PEZI|nr:hypothetical protein B0T25DRAFT_594432 [Lasiosphaeria hispida]
MSDLGDRATRLLAHLGASAILLVEWETSLQIRLGYPHMPNGVSSKSRFFLIPDAQLRKVQDLAAELGFSPAHEDVLPSVYPCELSGLATGITSDEVVPILIEDGLPPSLPPSARTVPLPAACATFARIAAREKRASPVRSCVIQQLSSVVAYSLFDMSYEGDYMEILPNHQPLSEAEMLEIEHAVKEIKSLKFRKDEEWIKDLLVDIYTGKKTFRDIPCEKGIEMGLVFTVPGPDHV